MDAAEKAKLEDEWKRAQGMGRALSRQRMIATLASIAVTFGCLVVLEFFAIFVWGNVLVMGGAFLVSLMPGIWVRKKLWPRGQFA